MWTLDKYGAAINLEKMIVLRCITADQAIFSVVARSDREEDCDQSFDLADFETRADAKAFIADLVQKLNLEKNHGQIAHNENNKAV